MVFVIFFFFLNFIFGKYHRYRTHSRYQPRNQSNSSSQEPLLAVKRNRASKPFNCIMAFTYPITNMLVVQVWLTAPTAMTDQIVINHTFFSWSHRQLIFIKVLSKISLGLNFCYIFLFKSPFTNLLVRFIIYTKCLDSSFPYFVI